MFLGAFGHFFADFNAYFPYSALFESSTLRLPRLCLAFSFVFAFQISRRSANALLLYSRALFSFVFLLLRDDGVLFDINVVDLQADYSRNIDQSQDSATKECAKWCGAAQEKGEGQ